MLKKIGFATAGVAAGMVMLGGVAAAEAGGETDWYPGHDDDYGQDYAQDQGYDQVGLLNLQNIDVLHNVNVNAGVCDNNVNVLGVQVPIQESLNGIGVPILSPGAHEAEGVSPSNCASASLEDGGSVQDS